jgi:outer membrane protein OmpA-like peptidoglycan-associated protein
MITLLALSAYALDSDTYKPVGSAYDQQGGLQVMSPSIGWSGSWYAGLGLVYAHNPVVRTFEDGSSEAVVASSFATRLGGGYNIAGKVRLDLDLPIYPFVGGGEGASFSGFSTGDARLDAVIPVMTRGEKPLGLAVVPMLNIPTGQPAKNTGSGFGAGLAVALGLAPTERVFIDGNIGAVAVPAQALGEFTFGSALSTSIGVGYRINEQFLVGGELDSAVTLAGGIGPYNKNPVELHAYGTYGTGSGLTATVGLGTGIVAGVGAPDVRVIAQVGYRMPGKAPIYDVDGDGIMDPDDKCVDVPEDADNFEDSDGCPEVDNDQDGIPDTADACPLEKEDKDNFEDSDGCPEADNDRDGLTDGLDACPLEPGPDYTVGCPDTDSDKLADKVDACPTEPGPERTKGCPDTDSDLVPDKRDKCPTEPIDPREDPERSDGCPKRVFVSTQRIEILDKIYFDTNKTTIKSQSFPLLEEIAKTLNDNPDILRVEVAGHTDSDGKDEANLKLSQGRAESVVKWLATKGNVTAERLYAVGYGETKPIDTNSSTAGKANNRRVEFVIKATRPKLGTAPAGGEAAPAPLAPTEAPTTPAPQ